MLRRSQFVLLVFLLLFQGGRLVGNESAENYFPGTVDSFWVYEDQDGNEFTRTVVEGEEIADEVFSAFSYEPELEDWVFYNSLFRPSLYNVNDEGIKFVVGNDLKKSLNARIKSESEMFLDMFQAQADPDLKIDFDIKTEVDDYFLLLPDSVAENEEWDSIEAKVVLSMRVDQDDLAPEVISFIFTIVEAGKVIGRETVIVPAGTFENCLKVEYSTETSVMIFPDEAGPDDIDPAGETVTTVWFVPNVGIVKYEQKRQFIFLDVIPDDAGMTKPDDPEPITIGLKRYEIKTEDSD